MIINTTRFGEVHVAEDQVFVFNHGLPGFPAEKSFALLPYRKDSPFFFLQSTTNPDLAFLVVDPFAFFQNYEFELGDTVAQELGLTNEIPPYIMNIVTVPEKLDDMTVNLLAPVIINKQNGQAVQVVLENTAYQTRHRLFSAGASDKEAK